MSSDRTVAGAWAITVARHVGLVVIGLAWTTLAARSLGTAGTGRVILAATIPVLLAPIANLGFPYAVSWLTAQRRFDDAALGGVALSLGWSIGSAAGLIGIGALLIADTAFGAELSIYVLGMAGLPSFLALSMLGALYQGREQFGRHAATLVTPPALALVTTGLLLFATEVGETGFVAYWVASYFVVAVVTSFVVGASARRPSGSEFRAIARSAFSFGWKLWVSEGAVSARSRLDLFLVGGMVGSAAAGLYGAAVRIAAQVGMVSQAANFVVFPMVARDGITEHERGRLTPLVARLATGFSIVATIGLILLGRWAIELLLGTEFVDAYLPLLWYLPAVVLLSVSRVLTADISARGKPEIIMRIAVGTLAVNVALNLALIPTWGINGAAIAASLTAGLNAAWRIKVYRTMTGVPVRELLVPSRKDVLLLLGRSAHGGPA